MSDKSLKRRLPIDRPCSACSGGDPEMKHHMHSPPFREGYGEATGPSGEVPPHHPIAVTPWHKPNVVYGTWEPPAAPDGGEASERGEGDAKLQT